MTDVEFSWVDLLPELINILVAITFLVLFLLRMRKLHPFADSSRFSRTSHLTQTSIRTGEHDSCWSSS